MAYNSESRQRRAELTRQKIYDSAIKLFTEHDYSQVSIDSIVKLAGVAKGSFYVHFDSKDAVIAQIVSEYVNAVDEDYRVSAHQAPHGSSASDIIMTIIAQITNVLSVKVGYHKMKALYRSQLSQDFNAESVFGYSRKLYLLFQDEISNGIESGEFRNDIDSATLARHIVLSIRGLTFEWCIRDGIFDYPGQSSSFFSILLDGLRRR